MSKSLQSQAKLDGTGRSILGKGWILPAILLLLGFTCLQAQNPNVFYFPQIGDGAAGGLTLVTEVIFVNRGEDTTVVLEFFGSDGNPVEPDLVDLGRASRFEIPLLRGASASLQTSGTGDAEGRVIAGYARVTTGPGVGGSAVFTTIDPASGTTLSQAGVGAAGLLNGFSIFVDQSGSNNTGLAIARPLQNGAQPAGVDANLTLILYDSAFNEVERTNVVLGPGRHLARFVSQLFENSVERGSLSATSDQPITVVTLRQNLPRRPFPDGVATLTTLPVFPESTILLRAGLDLGRLGVSMVEVLSSSPQEGRFRLFDNEGQEMGVVRLTGEITREDEEALATSATHSFLALGSSDPVSVTFNSVMPLNPEIQNYPSSVILAFLGDSVEVAYDLLVPAGDFLSASIEGVTVIANGNELALSAAELADEGAAGRYQQFLEESGAGFAINNLGVNLVTSTLIDDQVIPYTPSGIYFQTSAGDEHDEGPIPAHSFWACTAACGTHAACYFGAQIPPPCWVACAICGWCLGEAIWGAF